MDGDFFSSFVVKKVLYTSKGNFKKEKKSTSNKLLAVVHLTATGAANNKAFWILFSLS